MGEILLDFMSISTIFWLRYLGGVKNEKITLSFLFPRLKANISTSLSSITLPWVCCGLPSAPPYSFHGCMGRSCTSWFLSAVPCSFSPCSMSTVPQQCPRLQSLELSPLWCAKPHLYAPKWIFPCDSFSYLHKINSPCAPWPLWLPFLLFQSALEQKHHLSFNTEHLQAMRCSHQFQSWLDLPVPYPGQLLTFSHAAPSFPDTACCAQHSS